MEVFAPAREGKEPAGSWFDEGVDLPLGVEELEEAALEVLAELREVDQAAEVVVGGVVLVDVRVPVCLRDG